MSNLLSVFVTFALFILFPMFIFYMLVRALRTPGTRWWGIVILIVILTCYCTTFTAIIGLIAGGGATGAAELERNYCAEFGETLTRTESLPDAIARMDAVAATENYRIKASDRTLRFRYVWLLGGCFLFAGANLMMFGKGRRERRNPSDCIVMIIAALFVFLTGIWQISWGNGYAFQASTTARMLPEWHDGIPLDAIREPNAKIAAKLSESRIRNLHILRNFFLELAAGKNAAGQPQGNEADAAPAAASPETENPAGTLPAAPAETGGTPSVAIIGGADGPTAIFLGSGADAGKGKEAAPAATPAEPEKPTGASDGKTEGEADAE